MCDANHMLPLIRLDFSEGGPTDLPLCFPFHAPPTLLSLTSSAHNLLRPITDTLHTSPDQGDTHKGFGLLKPVVRTSNIRTLTTCTTPRSLLFLTNSPYLILPVPPSTLPIISLHPSFFLNLKISLYSQPSLMLVLTGPSFFTVCNYTSSRKPSLSIASSTYFGCIKVDVVTTADAACYMLL